jgi:hypothetical protein
MEVSHGDQAAGVDRLAYCAALDFIPGLGAGPASPPGMEPGGMMQMQMMGMMQQMAGMMKQMAVMMAGGQITPERMKQMGQVMAQMTEMMTGMSKIMGMGMMGGGGQSGSPGGEMMGADMMKQMSGMMERMAEMQKRMAEMLGAK